MEEVKFNLDDQGHGIFFITHGARQLAEMVVGISGNRLTVYHTEVSPQTEEKGLAKKLLAAMTAYARNNRMMVVPLCPYVHTQFKRHPEEYADIWEKE